MVNLSKNRQMNYLPNMPNEVSILVAQIRNLKNGHRTGSATNASIVVATLTAFLAYSSDDVKHPCSNVPNGMGS